MKPTLFVQSAVILVFFFITACESTLSYDDAINYNRQNIKEAQKVEDANFLVKAKSLATLQASLLQLAQEKGYSSATVNLGKDNAAIFKTLESDIGDIAGKEDIKVADTMDSAHMQLFEEINGTDRPSFDQKFIFSLKSINQQMVQLFEGQATKAFDPDVRAFAARKLGQLQSHAENLSAVEKELIPVAQ